MMNREASTSRPIRRSRFALSLALASAMPVAAVACGGSRAAEAPAATPQQGTAPADAAPAGAPAMQEAPATEEAPQGAARKAYGQPPPSAAPRSSRPEAEGEDRGEPADFAALSRDLDRSLSLSAPDCTLSWALRDKICDLAQRLCDLAGRSAEPDVGVRCTDGRARCEHATARVRAACAE